MFRKRETLGNRWQRTADEHAAAVAALLVAASLVPDEKWRLPLPPGPWSPAQLLLQVAAVHDPKVQPSPDEDAEAVHAMSREALSAHVQSVVVATRNALRQAAATGDGRMRHPSLGNVRAVEALRLLSAHAREQARRLAPPKITGGDFPCVPALSPASAS